MKTSLNKNELLLYVKSQIQNNFNDGTNDNITLSDVMLALDKIEFCFNHINLKYYKDHSGDVFFDHLYGDSYAMFLYFLSRELFFKGEERGATKLFLLNKLIYGIDIFYTVSLPNIFYFTHAYGTVLGAAKYSDYLVVYQGVTVGSDLGESGLAGAYPSFGEGVILFANTSIIGACDIANNVTFGANSFLRNSNIAEDKIVVGHWPNFSIKTNSCVNKKYYFGV